MAKAIVITDIRLSHLRIKHSEIGPVDDQKKLRVAVLSALKLAQDFSDQRRLIIQVLNDLNALNNENLKFRKIWVGETVELETVSESEQALRMFASQLREDLFIHDPSYYEQKNDNFFIMNVHLKLSKVGD